MTRAQSFTQHGAFAASISALRLRLVRLFRSWSLLRSAVPNPARIAQLAETIALQPSVRHWLLIIASESPRLRRALLARAAFALRQELGISAAALAFELLEDTVLVRVVFDTLLFQNGLTSPSPQHRTGRSARVRCSELARKLDLRDTALQTA